MSEALGRVAGIDFGTVRIGIALSDPGRMLASPYENYTRSGEQADQKRFERLVKEEEVTQFVVGLPLYHSGDASPISRQAQEFGNWLARITNQPVTFYDERYTSVQAEQALAAAQFTSKKRKGRRDMLAAQILLASWLESSRDEQPAGPLDDEPDA